MSFRPGATEGQDHYTITPLGLEPTLAGTNRRVRGGASPASTEIRRNRTYNAKSLAEFRFQNWGRSVLVAGLAEGNTALFNGGNGINFLGAAIHNVSLNNNAGIFGIGTVTGNTAKFNVTQGISARCSSAVVSNTAEGNIGGDIFTSGSWMHPRQQRAGPVGASLRPSGGYHRYRDHHDPHRLTPALAGSRRTRAFSVPGHERRGKEIRQ